MKTYKSIVSGDDINVPQKSTRIRIRPVVSTPSLAGMMMKVCTDVNPEGIEGTMIGVSMNIHPGKPRPPGVARILTFEIQDDLGVIHKIERLMTPQDIGTVDVVITG